MWMQVAGAACNISTKTNKQPSHHQDEQQQVVNLEGGRRLRPLIPRPSSSSSSSSHASNFGLYTAGSVEAAGFSYNKNKWKEESNSNSNSHARPSSLSSLSRWNPTAEQVGTLEELYSNGTRSPSTEEIQVITAQLRRYGNIEGKNVFYWFQNHKARERHKRRRHNLLLATKDGASTAHNYWKLGFDAQHSKEFGEMSMQLEREGRRGVSVSDIRSESTATTTTTRPNNPIIGSRAVACNATWRNLDPSSSSSSSSSRAIFKTRRLVGTDGTSSIHRERGLEYEEQEQDQDSAPLLQLFPLRALVNAGQHHEETKTDDVRFFQFLPPKSIN